MKIMITMNMPNSSGMPLHKLIAETPHQSIQQLFEHISEREFILVNQFYVSRSRDGEALWDDLGVVILNTYHIAKIQEYVDREPEEDDRPAPRHNPRNQYRR